MAWTSPRTWVAGEVPSATTFNTHVRDNLKAVGDAWATYTPALTQWTLGNGTVSGRFLSAGKLTHYSIRLTFGSTTASGGSGILTLSLPVAAEMGSNVTAFPPVGWASLRDISAPAQRQWMAVLNGASTILIADASLTPIQATIPWTWAAGDLLVVNGTYEAA